jgi:prepilin-type N-terminal cleavage/methylation domain-containing protein
MTKRAFTLVELLVVVGIMATMATMSIGGYFAIARGMADRGAISTATSVISLAQERARMDLVPTAVYFYNEAIQFEDRNKGTEFVAAGVAIAVRRSGRISRITGLAAVADGTGRRAGQVQRVCVSEDGQWVTGLILTSGSLVRRKRYVPFAHITLWGEVTVSVDAVQPVPKELKGAAGIVGMTVTDTCGERVGRVTDAFVEEKKKSGLSAEDFERCRRIEYAEYIKSFDSTEEIANTLLSFVFAGAELFSYSDVILQIDLPFVEGLMREIFDSACTTLSVVYPDDVEERS